MSSFPMAGRGPRARYYAGANSLSVFSAQGSNPLQDCKVVGKGVTKVYDKSLKGYVYNITGGLQSKMQLPKDDSKTGLQLLHHFLVLQLFVPRGVHFSVELSVSDTNNTRRKMYFSTSFSDMKSTPLHCQIPISMVIRNKWLSLAFHVADLFNNCFRGGVNFRSTDIIVLGPVCKLRKIFTMRCCVTETAPKGYLEEASENCLPQEHVYTAGVDTCVQTLDMASVQSAKLNSNDAHTDDSGPNAGVEFGLGAQNGSHGKAESTRAVHVAFGTRMPLPLSTVQINTNLPHDKFPTLCKDRIGKVHFISDPAAGGEVKEPKPPSNMVVRALSVTAAKQEAQRRKAAGGASDCSGMKMNRTGPTVCPAQCIEEKNLVNSHTTSGEPEEGTSGDSNIEAAQDPLPNSPILSSQDPNPISEGHVSLDTTNKSPSKWVPRKREVQISTKQQKKNQRLKEYEHSRYMDSPPGSPPCGWDRFTGGGNQSDDIAIHDHFLEGSWMNSQLSESIDAGKPYCLANSLKEKILSCMPHSLSARLDDEKGNQHVLHRDSLRPASDYLWSKSTSPPYGDIHTNQGGLETNVCLDHLSSRDIGHDHGHLWADSAAIAYDSYSEGQSWSSGSSSVPGDVLHEFPRGATHDGVQKLGRGPQSNCDLQRCLPTSLLAKGSLKFLSQSLFTSCLSGNTNACGAESEKKSHDEDEELMFDIHDDRFFPTHLSENKKDMNGLVSHSMAESFFSTEGKGVGNSFDSSEGDTPGELEYSFQETPITMTTSSDFRNFTLGPARNAKELDIMLKSSQVPECDRPPSCTFPSNGEHGLAHREFEGPIKSNIRPDEDLDLLYDPTLDCYYDPKTNRYYELK